MEDIREQILERVSTPVLLEQTAEECVELAHVLLKYARYLRGENPTDDNEYDIVSKLTEETADVALCTGFLFDKCIISQLSVESWIMSKEGRWLNRLLESEKEK